VGAPTFSNNLSLAEGGNLSILMDGVDEIRDRMPMTRAALDESLKALDAKGLLFQNSVLDFYSIFYGFGKPSFMFRYMFFCALWALSSVAIISVIWCLNDGTFASKQLVGGIVAISLVVVVMFLGQIATALPFDGESIDGLNVASLEVMFRWEQLISGKLSNPHRKRTSDNGREEALGPTFESEMSNRASLLVWWSTLREISFVLARNVSRDSLGAFSKSGCYALASFMCLYFSRLPSSVGLPSYSTAAFSGKRGGAYFSARSSFPVPLSSTLRR
jgi:hypothetical protein